MSHFEPFFTEMEETKETPAEETNPQDSQLNQGGAPKRSALEATQTAKTVYVALIGAAGVGKTSLIHRLGGRPFEPRYFPTEIQTYVVDMQETRFIVTEYGGQYRYDTVYDTNVDAIIVMTTASAADTRIAFELMRKMPELPYCFVENKSDIRTNNANMSCSVKKNENLEAPFRYLETVL
jgi:tRNA U34 5-carboxymethylaminomethyl modifying GTPase MnmE/TrmE